MFRSYNAFATKIYKIVMWIIYPLLAILCCILVQNGFFGQIVIDGYHFLVAASMLCNGIITLEGMGDYWMFSGIQSKNANHMDFLKSSPKGRKFFKDALIADVIRRAVTIAVCNTINVLIGVFAFNYQLGGTEGILLVLTYALCSYAFSTLAVFISRYGEIWYINLGMAYAANVVAVVALMMVANLKLPIWIWTVIYLVISIVVTIITIKVAVKKVEDSYYDQRS